MPGVWSWRLSKREKWRRVIVLPQLCSQQGNEHLLGAEAAVPADEDIFFVSPPQVSTIAGGDDEIAQAVREAGVGLARAKQPGRHCFGGVEEGELTGPDLVLVILHGSALPGAGEQVHQAVLTGGHDMQQAGQPRMVSGVIQGIFVGCHHTVVGGQQHQRLLARRR